MSRTDREQMRKKILNYKAMEVSNQTEDMQWHFRHRPFEESAPVHKIKKEKEKKA